MKSRNTRSRAQGGNTAKRRHNFQPAHRVLRFEALESRRMLSTINWANVGNAGSDSDGFNATFGPNAAQARLIVQRAISDWEEVIVNFQHQGGGDGNTYSLQVSMGECGGTLRAQGGPTFMDFDLVPTQGAITLDFDAAGQGWYIDPVIGDDGEFDTILGPYSATGTVTGNDLYRTITHEIGHAVGMTQNATERLALFLTDLMVDDPVADDGTNPGNLWAFNVNGGPIEATFTAADSGHFYEGPAIAGRPDIPTHPNDLMNPGRASGANNRKLISDLDATVLRDAYGYIVAMPSTLNNMLVNPNFTTDVLTINGQPGAVGDVVLVTSAAGGFNVVVGGFSEIVPLSQTASIAIDTGDGTDQVHLNYNAAKPTSVDGGDGVGDLLFLTGGATVTLTTVTSAALNTVTYDGLETLVLTGSSGNDIFSVKSTSSFTPVTINAGLGADTLFINPNSGSLLSYGSPITWNGGDGADTLQFDMQPAIFGDQYTVTGSAVLVDRLNGLGDVTVNQVGFSYFSDLVVINAGSGADVISLPETNLHGTFSGGLGNDSFIVGGGNVGTSYTSATLSGGTGNDSLVLDDSLYAGAANWAINDVNVQRNVPGSAQNFSYAGFEGIGIRTGAGGGSANNITTFGAIPVSVVVTGGAGADNFFINNFANEAAGGPAGPEQLQSKFDGGGGFNQLIVNDEARGILTYNMYPTRLEINEVLADDGEFSFLGIGAMSVTASDSLTTLNVYGTPAHIVPGNQTTVLLRGGNDVVNVFPHDVSGNLTVTTAIGIIGENGTDTFTVQDAVSAGAINYTFSNPFGAGTQNIFGMGTGGLGTATIENLVVNAGTGADVFNVDQYKSGTGLTLNAGGGDDVCNFGSNDVAANITSIASFLFNGQEETDTFNLRNANPANSFTYTAAANTTLQVSRTFPSSYFVSLEYFNTERKAVYAGPTVDIMNITSFASGELDFHGAGGDDALNLPTSSDLLGRRVNFFGDAGSNRINQVANSKTAPSILHVAQNTIGAIAGDNFFAPGGSVFFDSVQAIQLRMGSGADTAYMQPDAVAAISIFGGNPTTLPGDTLHLELATAENYVVNGTAANGSVTSTNLMTLSYSGFETGPSITTSPVLPGDYGGDGVVDAADYVVWRKMLGMSVPHAFSGADGNGNYVIGPEDHAVWRANFGQIPPPGAGSGAGVATALAEPMAARVQIVLAEPVALLERTMGEQHSGGLHVREPNQAVEPRGANAVLAPSSSLHASYLPAVRRTPSALWAIAASRRDEALVAWLASQPNTKKHFDDCGVVETWTSNEVSDASDLRTDSVDQVCAQLASN